MKTFKQLKQELQESENLFHPIHHPDIIKKGFQHVSSNVNGKEITNTYKHTNGTVIHTAHGNDAEGHKLDGIGRTQKAWYQEEELKESPTSFEKPEVHPLDAQAKQMGFQHVASTNMMGASQHSYQHPSGATLHLKSNSYGSHSFKLTPRSGDSEEMGTTAGHLYMKALKHGLSA